MLSDRPAMARYVTRGNKLWTWAVRKFAGEDLGEMVNWDPTSPAPFGGESVRPDNETNGAIRVAQQETETTDSPWQLFNTQWAIAVFELHNRASSREFDRINEEARQGRISCEEYATAMLTTEELSAQRTRAFFLKLFLPWMKSNGLRDPLYADWFCNSFFADDDIETRLAEWRTWPHWTSYSVNYDLHRAEAEYGEGEYGKVEQRLKKRLAQGKPVKLAQLADVHFLLGYAYWAETDLKGALSEFTTAVSLDPTWSEPALRRGTVLQRVGATREAIDQFTKLIHERDTWAEAYYERAQAWSAEGSVEKSLADLEQALRLDPKYADAYLARAKHLGDRGDVDGALKDLAVAIELEPQRIDGYGQRGNLWAEKGDFDKAIDEFSTIIRIAPNYANGYLARGIVHSRQDEFDKAWIEFDYAIRLDPKNSMYHYYRGQANFEKKQFPQAWSDYSEAVRLDSKNFYANYARAELSIAWKLAPSPCRPSAVQDAWRSCELTQWQSPDQINLLAAAYAASGNAQCARRWEEKARELRSAAERKVNANKGGTNTLSPHPSQSTNALKSVTNRRLQNEPNN